MNHHSPLPGVVVIEPRVFGDARGYFFESFQKERYHECGIKCEFVQDNVSFSSRGVLRGLHFQKKFPQGKLLQVLRGEIFDVVVDLRLGSPTFKQWYGVTLNEENHRQIYVPPGFAHGFLVVSTQVHVLYKCTDYYHPEDESGLIWNDPEIGIQWPAGLEPLLSNKDAKLPRLQEVPLTDLQKFIPA